MTRLALRVTGWAVLAAAAVTAMSGCIADVNAETPAQVRKQAGLPEPGQGSLAAVADSRRMPRRR